MRAQIFAIAIVLLTGCATTAKYEAKLETWENHDAQSLVNTWGPPNAIEKLSSGHQMYVYTRLRHLPVPYGTQRTIASAAKADGKVRQTASVLDPGEVYIKCATYFEMTPEGKIVSTMFRGEECKSKD